MRGQGQDYLLVMVDDMAPFFMKRPVLGSRMGMDFLPIILWPIIFLWLFLPFLWPIIILPPDILPPDIIGFLAIVP